VLSEAAIIHPSAKIAEGVTIGPGSIIGADVEIGEGTWIGPHVVIDGPCVIGKKNKIFQFASIGDEPQDVTYQGEVTRLEIGDNNIIREYCMISRGTVKGGGITQMGNHNYLMAYSHIGHDCTIGNHVIMVNYAALAGHVKVQDFAIIGAYSAIHQNCHIGAYAFIARATCIGKDVLPYIMVSGYVPEACGINTVGLRRRGFSSSAIDNLRRAYKVIFRKGFTVRQVLAELEVLEADCPEIVPMTQMLAQSIRGIVR